MPKIALLALTLTACGGSTVTTPDRTGDAEAPYDAAADVDTRPDADAGYPPDAECCCGHPGYSATVACNAWDSCQPISLGACPSDAAASPDANGLLCCSTNGGQNLLVCDPSSPWECNSALPTHPPFYCTDADAGLCAPGDTCQGFNGSGVVVVCGH